MPGLPSLGLGLERGTEDFDCLLYGDVIRELELRLRGSSAEDFECLVRIHCESFAFFRVSICAESS